MEAINKLELHYYFDDDSHDINAITRNKCEAELIAIILEVATLLDVDTKIIAEISIEGGFKDKWKALGENSQQLQVILMAVGLLTTIYFTYDPEGDSRTKELEQLQIQELKIKLQQMGSSDDVNEIAKVAAKKISKNLKITKRKSNFYTHLNNDPKIRSVSISALDNKNNPISQEKIIERKTFR